VVTGPTTHPQYALPDGFWEESPKSERQLWPRRRDGRKRLSLCLVKAHAREDWTDCAVLYLLLAEWHSKRGLKDMASMLESSSDHYHNLAREKATHRPAENREDGGS